MKEKQFEISFNIGHIFTIGELWPDGDAPENPTTQDVLDLIKKDGGPNRIISDWNFDVECNVTEV